MSSELLSSSNSNGRGKMTRRSSFSDSTPTNGSDNKKKKKEQQQKKITPSSPISLVSKTTMLRSKSPHHPLSVSYEEETGSSWENKSPTKQRRLSDRTSRDELLERLRSLSALQHWAVVTLSPINIALEYKYIRIAVQLSKPNTTTDFIHDLEISPSPKLEKDEANFLSGILESGNFRQYFSNTINPGTFLEALEKSSAQLSNICNILDEIREIEQEYDVFLKGRFVSSNGVASGGVVKISFTGKINSNSFIVAFRIDADYPWSKLDVNVLTRWDARVSKTTVDAVVCTQPRGGKVLTSVCAKLQQLCEETDPVVST